MKQKLLALAIMSLFATSSYAIEPFVVKDIKVEGIQRTEAGTVFNYLPIKVGETLNDEKAAQAIKALFATGFFKDVRLEVENGVLIVMLQERPAIAQIDITGTKEFDKDQLKKALKQSGIAESQIYDKGLLEQAEQELKRQYYSRGKYSVEIKTTVTPLERNRVAINFDVSEGVVANIKQINIVGNQAVEEKTLLKLFTLTTPGWITWFTKNDQYSKSKLSADIETLRSFYLNRGYLEFNIDSTQVSISPDKKDIYITVNIVEGQKYLVSDIKLAGEILVPEEDIRKLIQLKQGEVFAREKLTESTNLISDRLSNDGYAFANVNAIPEINKEKNEVAFTFFIDPGRRVYVRRINISGNTRTRDEVIRREMRQIEGSWYSGNQIKRSKQRIDLLGYFSDINIETPPVPEATDQVDVNINVTEKPTGSVSVGVGYGQDQGVVFTGSISQTNIFGSGKHLSAAINNGKLNQVYSVSFTDPYYTPDGISRGFDLYKRNVDPESVSLGSYRMATLGAGVRYGLPLNEVDTINFGFGVENSKITLFEDSPQRYVEFVNTFGPSNTTLMGSVGWGRDSRDSALFPTSGKVQKAGAEFGLPGGDLKYYRFSFQHQWYYPLSKIFTSMLNAELGLANGYGNKPLPFYKNFYAGGITSVRGFKSNTLGPRDNNDEPLGGNRRVVLNAELLFPMPGLQDKSTRMSAFFDSGMVFGSGEKFDLGELRYSVGLAVNWLSPLGPMKFSLAKPLNDKEGDKVEQFQFAFGSVF